MTYLVVVVLVPGFVRFGFLLITKKGKQNLAKNIKRLDLCAPSFVESGFPFNYFLLNWRFLSNLVSIATVKCDLCSLDK